MARRTKPERLPRSRRRPLRRASGVDIDDYANLATLGGRRGTIFDFEGKQAAELARRLRRALKERGLIGTVSHYRDDIASLDDWLEEVNGMIGSKASFVDGATWELLDIECPNYCILLCRRGYRIPKRAMWKGDDDETAD